MKLLIALLVMVFIFPLPAHSQSNQGPTLDASGNYHVFRWDKKDSRQYCYTHFWMDSKGNWKASTKFSNGKRIDGDHFQAVLLIADKDGGKGVAIKQVAGMRRAHTHGGAFERTVDSEGHSDELKATELGTDTRTVSYECSGENRLPDEEIAKAIVSAILKL